MEIYTNTPGVKQCAKACWNSYSSTIRSIVRFATRPVNASCRNIPSTTEKSESRFIESKVHKPKAVDLGRASCSTTSVALLCTRCIRFTKDIVDDDVLGIVNRGSYNTLTAYPGKVFDNNYTLNTVDICPVGALTSKDFRFQMRVWVLEGNQEHLHELCDRLQYHRRLARRKIYTATRHVKMMPSTRAGCAIMAV